ncbi:thyroid stimulating hormone subunit beta a [Spinachia spinachia]
MLSRRTAPSVSFPPVIWISVQLGLGLHPTFRSYIDRGPESMETALFPWWLLFLLLGPAAPTCFPTDFTLYVERPECDYCVAVNTTICMGFCYSRDSNIRAIVGPRFLLQTGCNYDRVEYRAALLPGCAINADPVFTYPVALSCQCGACRTDSDECAHRATGGGGARCTKPVRRIRPFPGQSTDRTPF